MPESTIDITRKTFITPLEASELYGGSDQLWRRFAREGEVRSFRLGRTLIVFRREDVERFIESHPVSGAAEHRDGRRRGKRTGRPPKA